MGRPRTRGLGRGKSGGNPPMAVGRVSGVTRVSIPRLWRMPRIPFYRKPEHLPEQDQKLHSRQTLYDAHLTSKSISKSPLGESRPTGILLTSLSKRWWRNWQMGRAACVIARHMTIVRSKVSSDTVTGILVLVVSFLSCVSPIDVLLVTRRWSACWRGLVSIITSENITPKLGADAHHS